MANVTTGTVVYSSDPTKGQKMSKRMEQIALDYVQPLEDGAWVAEIPFIKIGNDRKFLRKAIIEELAAKIK
ncbi:hypothetical protein AHMF7605_11870 [Adhaeribacter arboris]|uniref:Uncharacterized protein n=1 Tax=Adhaeribacter arboris TaxID=2072846 RepID=A0A2T2YF80_9BACT|nr:hypothetical protein [Adhaeribacter arboris]PSR54169.1 hypothetical protein AHMF7605_11870 [Adhaeribacter arboris]